MKQTQHANLSGPSGPPDQANPSGHPNHQDHWEQAGPSHPSGQDHHADQAHGPDHSHHDQPCQQADHAHKARHDHHAHGHHGHHAHHAHYTYQNILAAFLLNASFAAIEFFGGLFTGSVAVLSDAVHDLGDALSIFVSFLLERKSKKEPDSVYTYGYSRYSVMGSVFTTLVLLVGSVLVILGAIHRFFDPVPIKSNGMIVLALFGMVVNYLAARFTHGGHSLNEKAVNLHMLEDVLGWAVVFAGSLLIRWTGLLWIDPLMSIGVALFIMVHALENLRECLDLFLEKAPSAIAVEDVREKLQAMPDILDVHHVHIWSLDGQKNCVTLHAVSDADPHQVKEKIRQVLQDLDLSHATIELEKSDEICAEPTCCSDFSDHIPADPTGSHHGHTHNKEQVPEKTGPATSRSQKQDMKKTALPA